MITKDTATDIALAYREIEAAETLLGDVRAAIEKSAPLDLRDAFGRPRGLQLGFPMSDSGQRLFNLPMNLAVPIIEANIAHHRARLVLLSEKAAAEHDGSPS